MNPGQGALGSVENRVPPEEELKAFRGVVRSLMKDAGQVVSRMMLSARGTPQEEQLLLLDRYIRYTMRFCENEEWTRRP